MHRLQQRKTSRHRSFVFFFVRLSRTAVSRTVFCAILSPQRSVVCFIMCCNAICYSPTRSRVWFAESVDQSATVSAIWWRHRSTTSVIGRDDLARTNGADHVANNSRRDWTVFPAKYTYAIILQAIISMPANYTFCNYCHHHHHSSVEQNSQVLATATD